MSMWSRVTLVGETRRLDMVLPARTPVGALMPDVLELLNDRVLSPPRLRHLVTSTGEVLDPAVSLADRRIPDGAVLRLVHADEPLPTPVVHEVPEVVGDRMDDLPASWGPEAARWTSTAAFAGLTFAAGLTASAVLPADAAPRVLAGVAAVLLAAGAAVGRLWREPLGSAITISGGAVGALALWAATDGHWPGAGRWAGLAVVTAVVLALLGVASPLGRGGLLGGGTAALLAASAGVCAALGLDAARTAAVVALGCVILLGSIVRLAVSLSGLTALDDRRDAGDAVLRGDVLRALDGAHRSLAIATIAVSLAAGAAGLGALTRLDGYTAALAGLLALILAGRARVFPLVVEKAALLAAAVTIVAGLCVRGAAECAWGAWPALAALAVALAVPAAVLAGDRPEHVRARLRLAMNRIEALAAVAIVPVAIGAFGTFERLLGTF
ncbi:type VII secretion integral membrane protein EccD [Actinomadura montaniterrae]|uniref:Type VII secretion integral membrane protein EccD n=1 Tax=Actinomadura montaniterrae TaxID=1803903 RepID=A0A6L3W1M3_9ACTN|nr:type VII secretion integral membrane protein EccD [Actinomadura montaniterrae]KAB2388803.1 type VII secretion integral membrane protein EccD [Actinomadura montaniterrae]